MLRAGDGALPTAQPQRGAQILFLSRRDCRNPEGGGSEIYLETVARALAAGGNRVTIRSAAFEGSPAVEWADGVRILRSGTKLGVLAEAFRELRRGEFGSPDVVVDVQNGVPFASPLACEAPTVVLVHHIHREQWPVVYGPVRARIGWWVESRVAPLLYRGARYVAVSEATRAELVRLGVNPDRIDVVRNGVQSRVRRQASCSTKPRIVVLGRLVPHKQVEHVMRAAAALRDRVPGLTVSVVGDGWWREEVVAEAKSQGVADIVEFRGFVDDATKQAELERAWVLALPSLKEGWGLVVTEAAAHGVPSVAYRSAGGVTESIHHGRSGLLVDGGEQDFADCLCRVLTDGRLRAELSAGAGRRAAALSWAATAREFADVLTRAAGKEVAVGEIDDESSLSNGALPQGQRTAPQGPETEPQGQRIAPQGHETEGSAGSRSGWLRA